MVGETEPHHQQAIKRGPMVNKLTSSTSQAFPYGCNNANDMKGISATCSTVTRSFLQIKTQQKTMCKQKTSISNTKLTQVTLLEMIVTGFTLEVIVIGFTLEIIDRVHI